MNRVLLLAVSMVAFAVSASAQDVRKAKDDMAFLFSYNGIGSSSVGAYAGGVGAQWYLANDLALRLGLGFGTSSTENPGPVKTTVSGTAISLSPGVRLNVASNSNIVGYVGGQVSFGTTSTKTEVEGSTNNPENSGSNLGVGVFFGSEWFPTKNLSLGFEYGLGFMSTSTSAKVGDTSSDGPSTSSIYLGTPASLGGGNTPSISVGNVAITVALYFN